MITESTADVERRRETMSADMQALLLKISKLEAKCEKYVSVLDEVSSVLGATEGEHPVDAAKRVVAEAERARKDRGRISRKLDRALERELRLSERLAP
jgi:hypothetical protein